MRKYQFSSFQELSKYARDRTVVLFGGGNIADKTIRRLNVKPEHIIDNNPSMWGVIQSGLTICGPKILSHKPELRPYIVICTTSFTEVCPQLEEMGYVIGEDFIVSPILNDLRIIAEMESYKTKFLFTSGAPSGDDARFGGGLYELNLDGDYEYRKVLDGNMHGLIKFDENIVVVDDNAGLLELSPNYEVIRVEPLPTGARGHGVSYCEVTERFYVGASYMDAVLMFDRDFKPCGMIPISEKIKQFGSPQHHCNDVVVYGESLFVSMFSATGNWKRDVFDGAVLEFDLHSGKRVGTVASDLWMPHNVTFVDGGLVVLDSLRGNFLRNNMNVSGSFPGFTRGLAYDGNFFLIGQSRNRNYSKNIGLSNNISIDASVIVFDDTTKISRSLQLHPKVSEVHGILSI